MATTTQESSKTHSGAGTGPLHTGAASGSTATGTQQTAEKSKEDTSGKSAVVNEVSKLSTKAMGCNPKKIAVNIPEGVTEPVPMATLYGKATGVKEGEDANGKVYSMIVGEFEGTNLETGDVYRASRLFLPEGIQETVEQAIANSTEEKPLVIFALMIMVRKATNAQGYSYVGRQLLPTVAADPLAEIREKIAIKLISAPKSAK